VDFLIACKTLNPNALKGTVCAEQDGTSRPSSLAAFRPSASISTEIARYLSAAMGHFFAICASFLSAVFSSLQ